MYPTSGTSTPTTKEIPQLPTGSPPYDTTTQKTVTQTPSQTNQVVRLVLPSLSQDSSIPSLIGDISSTIGSFASTIVQAFKTSPPNEIETITFSPTLTAWNRTLDPLSSFMCQYYIKNSLFFQGKLNRQKFIDAMRDTLNSFHFLYGKLYDNGSNIFISYTSSDSIPLEIETKKGPIQKVLISETLPTFDPTKQVFLMGVDGQPVIGFKLTQFDDGFVIGCCFNHIVDQSSMGYFFKHLSQNYEEKCLQKEPVLLNIEELTAQSINPVGPKNIEEFRSLAQKRGNTYVGNKLQQLFELITVSWGQDRKVIELRFNEEKLKKMCKSSSNYMSSNDIINAVLLRIYAQDPAFKPEDEHTFGFACNMRKCCGLGPETIGNILSACVTSGLVTKSLRSSTLLELAQKNRARLQEETNKESYLNSLSWFSSFRNFSDKPTHYVPSFLVNPKCLFVTNWSTFDYSDITFNGQAPVKLAGPSTALQGVTHVAFDYLTDEKWLVTSLAIPNNKDLGDFITQLAKDNDNLFTWKVVETDLLQ